MRIRVLLLAWLTACSASATTIVPRSLPALVAEADLVVEGRVVALRCVEDMRLIFTEYDVEVVDWVKPGRSERARVITVRQPGGTMGDVTMTVPGAAHFEVGDEVLLFTKDYGGQGHQQVANLAQGALPLVVAPGLRAGETVRRAAGADQFPGGAPTDLAALKARIRALAAEVQP